MRRRAVSKVSGVLAGVLAVVLLAGPVPASAEKSTEDKFQPLTSCVIEEKSSSWLFLMDTSSSLTKENVDPDDLRVDALAYLLKDLNRQFKDTPESKNTDSKIYVEILEFGSTVRRAKGLDGPYWQSLNDDNEEEFLDVVERLTEADSDNETDYLRALRPAHRYNPDRAEVAGDLGVIELFDKQDRDTCQVLVWFSDGKLSLEEDYVSYGRARTFTAGDIADYDLEPRDKKLEELSEKERAKEAVRRVEKVLGRNESALFEELCRPNGPVDVVRGRGVGGLRTGEATFIVTVGLGESGKFGVLQAIAEGATEKELKTDHGAIEGSKTCGSKPGLGIFLNTKDVKDLPRDFFDVYAGRETKLCGEEDECSERVEFNISSAMTYFSALIDAGPGVAVTLEGPRGGAGNPYPLGSDQEPYETSDGFLGVDAQEGKNIRVRVESPMAGTWAIVFNPKHPLNWVQLIPAGTLVPRLVDKIAEAGKPPELWFDLKTTAADQNALTKAELQGTTLDLQVRVRPEGSTPWIQLKEGEEPTDKGTRHFKGDEEHDKLGSSDPLECEVRLEATYEYSPEAAPLTLGIPDWRPCEGEVVKADGTLEVDERATFPTLCPGSKRIELDEFFDADSSGNEIEHNLCFEAGENAAGTVCYRDSNPKTESIVKARVSPNSDPCLDFENNDGRKDFPVVISATQQELEQHFQLLKESGEEKEEKYLELEVRFNSKSSEGLASRDETATYVVAIKHTTTTEVNWTKVGLALLFSLLLPFLLLYAYNFFWGSRFTKTGPLQRADVDVVVRNGQLFPATGRNSIVNAEDFGSHAGVRSRSRKVQITGGVGESVAELAGRMPKLPHNEPWAEGRFQDGVPRYVLSEQGTAKEVTHGRLTPSVAPSWLLGVSIANGEASRLSEDWHARLLVVLPSGTSKPTTASFEELVPQINRVLDEHNEALHEWQNAAAADSNEPVDDEGLGPDVASPSATQMPQLPGDDSPKPNDFPDLPE